MDKAKQRRYTKRSIFRLARPGRFGDSREDYSVTVLQETARSDRNQALFQLQLKSRDEEIKSLKAQQKINTLKLENLEKTVERMLELLSK